MKKICNRRIQNVNESDPCFKISNSLSRIRRQQTKPNTMEHTSIFIESLERRDHKILLRLIRLVFYFV